MILQNFVPHPRYYGREVAEIADAAAKERWGERRLAAPGSGAADAGVGHRRRRALDEMKRLVAETQPADAGRRDPDPAEPRRLVGRARRGRRDRPRRAVGERRPHLARARLPEPAPGAKAPRPAGLRADRAPLRLSAVPGARSGWSRGCSTLVKLKYWSFIPRKGSGRRSERDDRPRARAAGDRARPRRRAADRGRADGAVRRDADPR